LKPLVTTVRALSELASGLSPDAISSSQVLHTTETETATFLIAAEDSLDEQRVVVMRDDNRQDQFVPDHLARYRREVLSRMASFAERARSVPLSLPRGWNQFKAENLVTFFAVPGNRAVSSRWIAEIPTPGSQDVVFWRATTAEKMEDLETFAKSDYRSALSFSSEWIDAFDSAARAFSDMRRTGSPTEDIDLPDLAHTDHKQHSFEEWLDAISDDQRAFVDAPTDKSIRLRGPAGSGKSLAIALKAVQETLRARDSGEELRVLIATHSWALASQTQDSIDSLGLGHLTEIDVLPLLGVGQMLLPPRHQDDDGFTLIGDDSQSGKQAQLDEISDVLDNFLDGDWVTYRAQASAELRDRFESKDPNARLALAWDLMIEFGSVIGAAAIFTGAGSERRYLQLPRSPWMMPLSTPADRRLIYAIYSQFMESLEARSLVTSDQVTSDFLSFMTTHAWNRARRAQGYDLVFVDEFHLFSPLERQVLAYLTRDPVTYPRLFMAVDPRQSPSAAFIGIAADETRSIVEDAMGEISNFELTTVHRFTPQILALIKHVHHMFPAFDLGGDWEVDLSAVESAQVNGSLPVLTSASTQAASEIDIYQAVQDLYGRGRMALAVVDSRQWRRYSDLAAQIARSGKFHVSAISGRTDIEGLGYRHRGLVVGSAEYLAGLQFSTVLVVGVPDLHSDVVTANEKTRILSLLYLALSRAETEIRVFVADEDGGAAEVLLQAVNKGLMESRQGSLSIG